MNDAERPSLIVKFSSTPAGELVCRVTDVVTHRSWVVPDAHAILERLQPRVESVAAQKDARQ
jgi:hypothetical protein